MTVRAPSLLPLLLLLLLAPRITAQAPIAYRVSFPAPEHHWAQVEVTFTAVPPGPLETRMSRSSPGRYAIHEFAKNVFDVKAYDGKGTPLAFTRSNPYQWTVDGHDGTIRILYKVYGDHVDGTYLAIDPTHAHMNIPATLMWARGMHDRPARITFVPPSGSGWVPATQLFPTEDPWTFTAPNFQYLMDSPTELSAQTIRTFTVRNPDGKEFVIRVALHHDANAAAVDDYVGNVQKIVREAAAVFGEYPTFDTGTYTFLGDYVPWGGRDGMEHRNSTVVASPVSLRDERGRRRVFGTVAHEFFHAWNVERIRPRSLEPFNFEEANISSELWFAEGFTSYYASLLLHRAGMTPLQDTIGDFADAVNTVLHHPGRQFRSAVEMSQMAAFTDAARSVDRTNFSTTVISYYTYGDALGLALDLELRGRSNGRATLDDYLRAMWIAHGKPGGARPGVVARPYTLKDAVEALAGVSGDRAFATDFFSRYIEGREVPDFARLLERAGILLRQRSPGAGWIGAVELDQSLRIDALLPFGSPAYDAGLDQGDVITSIGGTPLRNLEQWHGSLSTYKPGARVQIGFRRRDGTPGKTAMTIAEDPSYEAFLIESSGGTLTPEQKRFRDQWLGPKSERRY